MDMLVIQAEDIVGCRRTGVKRNSFSGRVYEVIWQRCRHQLSIFPRGNAVQHNRILLAALSPPCASSHNSSPPSSSSRRSFCKEIRVSGRAIVGRQTYRISRPRENYVSRMRARTRKRSLRPSRFLVGSRLAKRDGGGRVDRSGGYEVERAGDRSVLATGLRGAVRCWWNFSIDYSDAS